MFGTCKTCNVKLQVARPTSTEMETKRTRVCPKCGTGCITYEISAGRHQILLAAEKAIAEAYVPPGPSEAELEAEAAFMASMARQGMGAGEDVL